MPSVVGQITKGAVFDVLIDADAVGGDGGANTLPDDTVALSNVTQHNPTIAAAVVADNAVLRGDGGARGVQDSTVTIADDGVMSVVGLATGGRTDYDLIVGDIADYGMIRFGDAQIGRTSFKAGAMDLDGAVLIQNRQAPPTGKIEFIFAESTGGTARFAIPKSGVGNATYNARSMLIAGPAPADTDFVTIGYWQAQGIFHNLTCDTSGLGADLGVQYDLEVEHFIFVDDIRESTTDAGVTIDGVLIKDGNVDGVDISAHVADTSDPHGSTMTVSARLNTQEVYGTSVLGLTASSASIDTLVVISNDDPTKQASLQVEKDITLGGTMDGRDVAADGTVLDGAVLESDYNANTILAADADDTPAALTIAAQRLVGRITAGNITGLTAAEVRTLINVADGSNNYSHPNHTGDVTSVADGAQTIASDAVTYDKMQDVSATDKVLGRSTAGAGTVEEIPCTAAGRALIDDADAAAQRTTLDVYDRSTVIAMAVALG